jgi:hypothetical protein
MEVSPREKILKYAQLAKRLTTHDEESKLSRG